MARPTKHQLATDVLTMAHHGGVPDTFWYTDQRIERARTELAFSVVEAREYAEREAALLDTRRD